MGKPFDPYAVLDVPCDAEGPAIKHAHRRCAKKTHPDVGGDPATFAEISRAVAVLSDPAKRRRFDETGQTDDSTIGEVDAHATQIIVALVDQVIQEYFGNNPTNIDPEAVDLIQGLKAVLLQKIAEMKRARVPIDRHITKLRAVARRIRMRKDAASNIKQAIENCARMKQARADEIEKGIAYHERAVELLDNCDFDY